MGETQAALTDRRRSLASGRNGANPPPAPLSERLRRCDWTGFTQVDNIVLYCPGLTDGEKVVYAVLASFDWPDSEGQRKGYVYPGVATIAQLTGKSERQTRRLLASLQRKGLIQTRREGPLSATRYIVSVEKVDWRSLRASGRSKAGPSERSDIDDTLEVSFLTPVDVTSMTPKEDEGEKYDCKQYEDPGLQRQTVIDVQERTRQRITANGSIMLEEEGKAMPTEAEGADTLPEDGSSACPEPPDGVPAEVWEVLVRDYGQAAWVGALVYRARQSGRSPPLRKDFLSLWDRELERSGLQRP